MDRWSDRYRDAASSVLAVTMFGGLITDRTCRPGHATSGAD